jgi:hypothetical protein
MRAAGDVAAVPRSEDYPIGRQLVFCGEMTTVAGTLIVEDGTGPYPFMVLLWRPPEPPHPCDWVPVTSIERQLRAQRAV